MAKTLAGLAIALALLALPATAQQAAQPSDEGGQFYFDLSGSGVFPYEPKASTGLGLKAGAGFTAAFGYAFNEGISIEIEGGYQQVGIGGPSGEPSALTGGFVIPVLSPVGPGIGDLTGGGTPGGVGWTFESSGVFPTVEVDGEIKTPSLMGNFYYRYPKWRVSPYVGFGLGAFFHDRTVTSTLSYPADFLRAVLIGPGDILPPPPSLKNTFTHKDSRFSYQVMAGFLVRAAQGVEFRFGYRFRSSRGAPIDSDQIEAGVRFRL